VITSDLTRGEFRFTVSAESPPGEVAAPAPAGYQSGGSGEWIVIGLIALVPLGLIVWFVAGRHKTEFELPPYQRDDDLF
jgi:hypothetical protein